MIDDVDSSLRAMLEPALGSGTAVRFEPPTPAFSNALKAPAVDLFLYDVTEEIDRRAADWLDHRGDNGRVIGRQPPVRYYRLSYLVSAWGVKADDEHRLLSTVMRACLDGEVLAPEFCRGTLAEEESRVLVRLCLPVTDPPARAHDLWSSLGQPARSSLHLAVVAPLRPLLVIDIAAPADQISLNMNTDAKRAEPESVEVPAAPKAAGGGRKGKAAPAAPATVAPPEKRWTTFRIRERENVPKGG